MFFLGFISHAANFAGEVQLLDSFGLRILVTPHSQADHVLAALRLVPLAVYMTLAVILLAASFLWPLIGHLLGAPGAPRLAVVIHDLAYKASEKIHGYEVFLLMNIENNSSIEGEAAKFEVQLIAGRKRHLGRFPILPPGSLISFGDGPFRDISEAGSLDNVGPISAFRQRSTFQLVTFENVAFDDPTSVIVAARIKPVSGPWSRWCRRKLELKAPK
jgi:hypothetical protein